MNHHKEDHEHHHDAEHHHVHHDEMKHHHHKEHAGHAMHHGAHAVHHAHMVEDFRKRFWISLVLTVPILVLSPMLQMWAGLGESLQFKGDEYILFLFSTAVFFYGGYPFLKGLADELRAKMPGMMTLIGIAISVAYVYSTAVILGLEGMTFFWETATLIDIMLLGHWIEMKSQMGASRALEELAALMPSDAHKIMHDGSIKDVPLDELAIGDKVLVKPGEKIPADGQIIEGTTSINEAMLTGESKPVTKLARDAVIGGSINSEGSITMEIKKRGKDSFLAQVIDLVKEAQASKSKTQDLANRAALWLTIIALFGGAVTLFVWTALMNFDFAFALERTVTVMVITCPHALGLAIPLVVAVSTAISARSGLLIRNRVAFEQARKLHAIIFDKTGTLTEGKFGVTDIVMLSANHEERELLKYAASVEAHSEHLIAKGIVAASKETFPVQEFKAIPGKGAVGRVNGKEVKVVSPSYVWESSVRSKTPSGSPSDIPSGKEQNIKVTDAKHPFRKESFGSDKRIDTLLDQGKTVVYVLFDGEPKGAIALADIVRPESKKAVAMLKEMGIKTMMLTGDNRQVAQWVAGELGLDEYFAEVLPHQKAAKLKEVQSRGLTVGMVGDGVNDAPALAQADVGIAIGAGTDVAVETADIILVRSNPLDVVAIIQLARATYNKMVQNLAWATGYNAFAIPLAAGVLYSYGILLSPAVGAVLMSLSTIIVAINARFLKVKK